MAFGKEKVEVVKVDREMLESLQAATLELNLAKEDLLAAAATLRSAAATLKKSTEKLAQEKRRPVKRT